MSTNYLPYIWRQIYNMSNKNMTITDIHNSSKEFKDTHTISVSGFKNGGGKTTTRDLILSIRDELLVAINNLSVRIDNLVVKNNLKE